MIKLPFNNLLPYMGATHHWPMNTPTPFTTELIGGADMGISNSASISAQLYKLFDKAPDNYVGHTDEYQYAKTTLTGVSTHVTNTGITSWTLQFWAVGIDGVPHVDVLTEFANEAYHRPPFSGVFGNLVTLIFDEVTTNMDIWINKSFWKTAETGVTATTYGSINLFENRVAMAAGHVAFFPKALTFEEIATIYNQRQFLGKISGTATVDGAGSPATIRSFTRTGAYLAGETTAASDGTYELWTVEPAEQDILALPPAGVAARPIAHGPILPINAN